MKVSVYIATSLDGYIAREDGSLDWLPGSDGTVDESMKGEDYGYEDFIDTVDLLVMGRNTYETVSAFPQWPYGDLQVIILSNTLKKLSDKLPDCVSLQSTTPKELYIQLKNVQLKHIYIDGGKTIQSFLKEGLVDDIIITRVPVLIGSGKPLFGSLHKDINLKHIQTKPYKNGLIQSRYEVIQ